MPRDNPAPPLIDTDVIVRLLTGDDLEKQQRARRLFKQIELGEMTVIAPVTVMADCFYVLTSPSLYHLPKSEAAALLRPILRLPHFRAANRRQVLRALELCASANLSFGDAFIAATMEQVGSAEVYSFDRGFDRLRGITRLEP